MKWGFAAITCAGLASCGGQQEPSSDRRAPLETLDPQGQEIVFWYQHTRAREEALQALMQGAWKLNHPVQEFTRHKKPP